MDVPPAFGVSSACLRPGSHVRSFRPAGGRTPGSCLLGDNGRMAFDFTETPRELAERAANVLAPESDLFEDSDSAGLGSAMAKSFGSALTHPAAVAKATLDLSGRLVRVPFVATRRLFGQ